MHRGSQTASDHHLQGRDPKKFLQKDSSASSRGSLHTSASLKLEKAHFAARQKGPESRAKEERLTSPRWRPLKHSMEDCKFWEEKKPASKDGSGLPKISQNSAEPLGFCRKVSHGTKPCSRKVLQNPKELREPSPAFQALQMFLLIWALKTQKEGEKNGKGNVTTCCTGNQRDGGSNHKPHDLIKAARLH